MNVEYLTLFQTLEKLKGIPAPYQPHSIAQLANACMKDKIIPVFQYNAYALEHVSGTGENSEYITIPIRGYLTHKNLSNVFNWTNRKDKKIEFTEAVIYELTQKEELLYENSTILLAKKTFHNLRPFGNAKSMSFDVSLTGQTKLYSSSNEKDAERIRELGGIEISQSDLLFPTTQVESYIDSFICEYEESYSSLLMGTPTVTQTEPPNNDQLIKALAAAKAQITSLENDLKQAKADNDQLRLQTGKPADDKELASNSQAGVARMLHAILTEHDYDLSPPKGKGLANDLIVNASNNHGTSVTRNFVADWLIRAREAKINNTK